MDDFNSDYVGAGMSLLLIAGYHLFLYYKLKRDPLYTIQAVNATARAAWVESIMSSGTKDVLAVQTLRNSIMGATFLSSTAVLLIIGTLTLSAQGASLNATWHALNASGNGTQPGLWFIKLVAILLDMFVAFFSFAQAIRLFNHVGYMINVPSSAKHHALTPAHVSLHLNRAGSFYALGMRSYYIAVPLVFWLFGPYFMLLSTLVLIPVLLHLDRAPTALTDDYR